MIPVLINVLLGFLTLVAFLMCGFYSLFRNTTLMEELQKIQCSLDYKARQNGLKFTLFMTKRKVRFWSFIANDLAGRSMLLALVISVVQWGSSLKSGGGLGPIREFLENPGFLFYAQCALMLYISVSMAVIDHTVRLFQREHGQ